jgi:ABC-type dipeptide/oligopeptide/nickel transport system permease component
MVRYILKRLASFVPILAAVSVLVFFLVRVVPSDPIASLTKGKTVSRETRAALMEEFHLDRGLPEQYAIWIAGIVRGDFSSSYQYRKPVLELLAERLPTTLQLTLMSSLLGAVFSIAIGVVCAVTKNRFADRILSAFLVFCASAPSFLLAIVFMYLFAFKLRLFPSFGVGATIWDNIHYLMLPSIALSLSSITLVGRITRSSLITELESNYVIAERAKGTPFYRIILHHCLKNALVPVITIGGMQLGGMIVGAMLVENVFALGGIGILLVEGINAADYPLVQSIILILVIIFMTINLITDIIYAAVDPRIRASWQGETGT